MSMSEEGLSRRNFLTGAGIAALGAAAIAGGTALTGCSESSSSDGYTWDYETDVLFVGAGSSMMGAIDCHNAGVKAMLIEKRDVVGGDTWLCGGVIRAGGNTKVQQEYGAIDERTGKADTLEQFYEDWFLGEALGTADPEVVRKCVEWSPDYIDWFMERGVKFTLFTAGVFPVPRSHQTGMEGETFAGIGKPYTDAMEAELNKLGIEYHVNTKGLQVLRDSQDKILGVKAKDMLTGQIKYYKAKAVVLSTGGNVWNDELNARYNPESVNCLSNVGAQGNFATGDGHVMAMELGAAMNGFHTLYPGSSVPQPEGPNGESFHGEGEQVTSFHQYAMTVPKSLIFVNTEGKRFCSESKGYENFIGADVAAQTGGKAFVIIDQAMWDQPDYVLLGSNGSKEHMQEYVDQGAIVKADTLEEVATALYMQDPAQLVKTVETWNGYANAGKDPEFDRDPRSLRAFGEGPYYGFVIKPGGKGAALNVSVTSNMEVKDVDGIVIPGLYASGMWYSYGMVDYAVIGDGAPTGGSGMGINSSITTSKIAGQAAAEYVKALPAK